MNQLLKNCREALQQLCMILHTTQAEQEKQANDIYQGSRLGNHVRHVVDHFEALRQGITSGVIDYNRRDRGNAIETSIVMGVTAIEDIVKILEPGHSLYNLPDSRLSVISEIDSQQTISQQFDSTLRRELLYLINHTIHHTAYIKLQLKNYAIELPDDIGIAPGTATFLRNQRTDNPIVAVISSAKQ